MHGVYQQRSGEVNEPEVGEEPGNDMVHSCRDRNSGAGVENVAGTRRGIPWQEGRSFAAALGMALGKKLKR